jgi:hypothetical protein
MSSVFRRSPVAVCFSLLALSGCSVYLHDDNLQKQTDAALASYKAADVTGALKATIDAQTQFDKQLLDSVAAQDSAIREAELAGLVSGSGLSGKTPVAALSGRINQRLSVLGGGYQFDQQDWTNRHEFSADAQSQYDKQSGQVAVYAASYAKAGGIGFASCDAKFTPPTGLLPAAQAAATNLQAACTNLQKAKAQVDLLAGPVTKLAGANPAGLVASVDARLKAVKLKIDDDARAERDANTALVTAKTNVYAATKSATTIDAEVVSALKRLDSALSDVDKGAGVVGATNYKPSVALATIRFRKTNLCDILAASEQKSCSGGTPSAAATTVNQAVVGAIAGIAKVSGFEEAPTTGALSIALAYQTGIEAVAQANVNSLKQQQKLLQGEEDALTQEFELLVEARAALTGEDANFKSDKCKGGGLGDILPNKNCPDSSRNALARALSAYNLAWATGRTAARIDEIKLAQQQYLDKLQVAQANATARDGILTTTLGELDNFGQGGITPQTLAAFLQALGIFAIAKGVN